MSVTPSVTLRGGLDKRITASSHLILHSQNVEEANLASSHSLALQLLRLCRCPACNLPVREPVTLPCGHSSCLSCIVDQTRERDAIFHLPSSTHLPPRLPIASTTVPCPVTDCPRSAIGKGIGIWKGHRARYGADISAEQLSHGSTEPIDPDSTIDGFVVASHQDSNALSVIPPQQRDVHGVKYAISKYHNQPCSIAGEPALLRCDVTLSKVIETLRKFAHVEDQWPFRQAETPSSSYGSGPLSPSRTRRAAARLRRKQAQAQANQQNLPFTMQDAPGSRTEINERFLGVMGASEAGIEPGTVGGVSAVSASDSDEEYDYTDVPMYARGSASQADLDFEDDVGGAFARSPEEYAAQERKFRQLQRRDAFAVDAAFTQMLREAAAAAAQEPSEDRQIQLNNLHIELNDVLECQLCYMLLYEPMTTPCGHTFCRRCFARSLDHSTACPLCRSEMPPFAFFQEHSSNRMITKILTTHIHFNDEKVKIGSLAPLYEERKQALKKEETDSLLSTPIFVCTLGFPQMPTILHIFEPRYRLMIRRCLESGHPRFAMVMHSQDMSSTTPGMLPYGIMLEIKTVKMLHDGRSMIETVGSDRIRVMDTGSLDGYTIGRIECIHDVLPEAEQELENASMGNFEAWQPRETSTTVHGRSSSLSDLSSFAESNVNGGRSATHLTLAEAQEANSTFNAALGLEILMRNNGGILPVPASSPLRYSTTELVRVCTGFIETLRSGSAPWLMTRLNDTYGPMPNPDNVAAFGYWMALVMPIDEHEKAKLLPIRSSRLRLSIVVYWIEQLRQTWWFNHGCSVQ